MTKKRAVTYTLFAFSAFLIYSHGLCWAISISAPGSWSQTIGASNLTGGAGSNLNGTYQSDPAAVSVTITATSGNWGLNVKKSTSSNWPGSLHLYIQRTSDGSGLGSISGGNSYQEVTDIDQNFFSGNGDRSNVSVRLKLTGVSIQVPPDVYTATVDYTVSDE
jgi:hypothetical protein